MPELSLLCLLLLTPAIAGQDAPESQALANGGLELASDDGRPEGWSFAKRPDGAQMVSLTSEDPVQGAMSAFVDASAANSEFANLMQAFDAAPFQGKRVRFRAAVKTADNPSRTRVQMWFRVDRDSGMGAFDNMQDRPIRADDWEYFDIVLDIDDDATRMNVGLFIIGPGRAWIDDATVQIVDRETPLTMSLLSQAFAEAEQAPVQPFFTPWLLLAVLAVVLFVAALAGPDPPLTSVPDSTATAPLTAGKGSQATPNLLRRFALRFSLAYWLLLFLPQPFTAITPPFLMPVVQAYLSARDAAIRWAGAAVLGVEGEMVPPNGSGDTTHAYVNLFLCFVLAAVLGAATLLLDRLGRRHPQAQDLLRSYLRYVLALTMVGYGLAKLGFVSNQFPPLEGARLDRTYGDSSPMGLLWSFMGASRPYTFFAGLGELVGGVLLLFRRTTVLGAMVVFGVMLNVVMLNFAYDVPVKQYSAHLALAAILIALPDWQRLYGLLIANRATSGPQATRAFAGARAIWPRRMLKLTLVVFIAVIPLTRHVWRNAQYLRAGQEAPAVEEDSLLMNRGFRWISEVPFNR